GDEHDDDGDDRFAHDLNLTKMLMFVAPRGTISRGWMQFEDQGVITMAQAIIVSLEKDLPDTAAAAAYTKAGSGRALARESDRIDSAARRCGVAAITSLLSESQAALIEQLKADGFDPSKMRLPPEQWFTAAEGL